jgi:Ca-activated chloride channel family protein
MYHGKSAFGFAAFGLLAAALAADAAAASVTPEERQAALEKEVTQGALRIVKDDGTVVECPLKHTDVQADIAGFIARVRVTQTFENPTSEKIEAVYVFPLPHEAAVDDMTMVIGQRRIVGVIKRRDEARRIYQEALLAGQTAALLEQERPNIFTQSVGNIEPGQEVRIEISYVDVLRYDVGTYEFQFPMVVGPRYHPGAPIASPPPTPPELGGKVSPPVPDTTLVPDASRISPPVLKPGLRTGHDISLYVSLDAGVPVQDLNVANHQATIDRDGDRRARVTLDPADSLPNKDFLLRYDVTGKKPEMAVLAHTAKDSPEARRLGQGYFLLMIQPQEDERLTRSPPREIVFLVDVSGSMSGQPTAKVVEAMQRMLKLCRPIDTLQVITFASRSFKLFESPVPVTDENIGRALGFSQGLRGGGGTEMLQGVKLAIDEPLDKQRIRIVVMLTDGYIGNEAQIIEHVGKNCGDRIRFWAIGIGSSPNMFLIDGVARQGGGMGKKLGLNDDSAALTQEVMTRIQRAQLADIRIDWGSHQVVETYPARLPELWAGRPVIVFGRYSGGGPGRITVSGEVEGEPASWPLDVQLPAEQPAHEVLAKVWARKKIESLMHSTYYLGSSAVEEEVTALALQYRLMSQYTSFVAVDAEKAEKLEPAARPPRRMPVPVPLPEGTRWEGFFGRDGDEVRELDKLVDAFGGYHAPSRPMAASRADNYAFGLQSRGARPLLPGLAAGTTLRRGGQATGLGLMAGGGGAALANKSEVRYRAAAVRRLAGRQAAGLYGLPFSGEKPPQLGLQLQDLQSSLESLQRADGAIPAVRADDYARSVLQAEAAQMQKRAQQSLEAGQALQKQGKLTEARSALVRAHLFGTAASTFAYDAGAVVSASLQALEELDRQRIDQWSTDVPALKEKLDLVLRDQSIGEALATVAEATGLTIGLIPGSIEDAAALSTSGEPRVTYLDLRGATASQALDWILKPVRLSWWLSEDTIVAGSDRRREGNSAWVYDISLIALPAQEEVKDIRDYQQRVEAAKRAADELLLAVHRHLQIAGSESVAWFSPGELLVVASRETHARAARLLGDLADPDATPAAELAALHRLTSRRAVPRKDAAERQQAARRMWEVAGIHADFGWQLLAAAAYGDLDPEALTELTIVWHAKETENLLHGKSAAIALRSWWIVIEAARSLPDCAELQTLAEHASAMSRPALDRVIAQLEKEPSDGAAWTGLLYAALATRDDTRLRDKALDRLTSVGDDAALALRRTLAESLLAEPGRIDEKAVVDLIAEQRVEGDDMVVLTALAARRTGGEAWRTFRAEMQDRLGDQPLSGAVVVLVNRLGNPALPLVAAR